MLDRRDGKDAETPDENPGAWVVSLLDREDAPDWAIVTNGKTWRLYSRSAHSRATNYYEVDLEEALQSPSPGEAFLYFWLIFRSLAFETPAGRQSFLSRLLEESAQHAKELEERLKDRVSEEIFPRFAEGFIADLRAREGSRVQLALSAWTRCSRAPSLSCTGCYFCFMPKLVTCYPRRRSAAIAASALPDWVRISRPRRAT